MSSILNTKVIQYLPTIGCLLFLIFITIASINYPGGSQVNESAIGYNWVNNYLCDVIASESYNGTAHPFYKFGLAAMFCLCGGLSIFFYFFPQWLCLQGIWNPIIRWMGFFSMICAMMIFTDLHNIMIAIASILALPALFGIFLILYQKRIIFLLISGVFILLLLLLNNLIYYTDYFVSILPRLQKISCLIVIIWTIYMNWFFITKKHLT